MGACPATLRARIASTLGLGLSGRCTRMALYWLGGRVGSWPRYRGMPLVGEGGKRGGVVMQGRSEGAGAWQGS